MVGDKLLMLVAFALVVFAARASAATPLHQPFSVHGRVYCDTCRCGFETNVTTYIPGATVELQCKESTGVSVVHRQGAETDDKGWFAITVKEDHGDEICDVVLMKSPWSHCSKPDTSGRSKSRVVVTNLNGMVGTKRFANNLGFLMDHTLPVCDRLVHYYLHAYE